MTGRPRLQIPQDLVCRWCRSEMSLRRREAAHGLSRRTMTRLTASCMARLGPECPGQKSQTHNHRKDDQ
jgi:hypothetical protein